MRYGLSMFLWTDSMNDSVFPLLDLIKEIGYDAIEIPIFDSDVAKYAAWGKRLDEVGLARTAVTIRGPANNPISPDPAIRRQGFEANKAAVDCAAAAGCEALVGPLHSALNHFTGAGPTIDEWNWAVDSMRQLAEHAEKHKLNIGLEYLNRFECYLLNTAADAARFCREVNHPRCQLMYDTYHAHMEEKNIAESIRALKGMLIQVHVSENDRSTPGAGIVHWDATFDALKEIGFDNLLVVEALGMALQKLPGAKIWRRMYESERQLAADGLTFMKRAVAKRWN